MDSRGESLDRPRGAGRAPVLVYGLLLLVAILTVLVGITSPTGWIVAMLVPALALSLYIAFRVITRMMSDRGVAASEGSRRPHEGPAASKEEGEKE